MYHEVTVFRDNLPDKQGLSSVKLLGYAYCDLSDRGTEVEYKEICVSCPTE